MSDLLALCKSFNAAGILPIAPGFASAAQASILTQDLTENYVYNIQPNWNDLKTKGKVSFATSPLWTN